MHRRSVLLGVLVLLIAQGRAHEGMWLPTVLASVEDAMQAEGLTLSAEDIYSVNHGSLKDAVVLFGGGCTAEVISARGLILTNHHCGFSAIQHHSSLDHDLLKDGFWARTPAEELMNDHLTATFIIRMEDVTARVGEALDAAMTSAQRKEAIAIVSEAIVKEATEGTHHAATVRAFSYGNQFFLIVTETFRDVRLVGAPPGAIGKFGGDTDNWMWPRHTGDFSLFRIYCGTDGRPADPSPDNVPFTPRHVLPISMDGVKEGDFAMIFGFPGNTQRYLSSFTVEHIVNVQDPLRIRMREASLGVIDAAMRASDRTRIQYADKQAGISNAYKKWIGEVRGLKELDAIDRKRAFEEAFRHRADSAGREDLASVLDTLRAVQRAWAPYLIARDLFNEFVYYGPEVLEFADRFKDLALLHDTLKARGTLEAEIERLKRASDAFYKDYDARVDRGIFKALLPLYLERITPGYGPASLDEVRKRYGADAGAYVDALYARSVFASKERLDAVLAGFTAKSAKKLRADPIYELSRDLHMNYQERIRPAHMAFSERQEAAMRSYVCGMLDLFPGKPYWPDANGTLRLSYGKVEGSVPRDGVVYTPFTTLDGVIAKYEPGDAEFDLPPRLLDLHARKDYGPYAEDGELHVCFTASLHTTGGNSGSPVINGRGELIGLNFDRTWESTMSDVLFDPAKCRNIAVDIRYVLFIIDKYAGATNLIGEMELVDGYAPAPVPVRQPH